MAKNLIQGYRLAAGNTLLCNGREKMETRMERGNYICTWGIYTSRGVAILIPEFLSNDIAIKKRIIDNNGRYIF